MRTNKSGVSKCSFAILGYMILRGLFLIFQVSDELWLKSQLIYEEIIFISHLL